MWTEEVMWSGNSYGGDLVNVGIQDFLHPLGWLGAVIISAGSVGIGKVPAEQMATLTNWWAQRITRRGRTIPRFNLEMRK